MPSHWLYFQSKSLLGGSLLGQQRYAEAEPLLLAGYEGLKQREEKIPPQSKIRLTEAVERLVQLYDTWDQKDKADEWRKKLPVVKSAKPAETKTTAEAVTKAPKCFIRWKKSLQSSQSSRRNAT